MKSLLLALTVLSCGTLAWRTAGAQPAIDALIACSDLREPASRLHCYDTQVAPLKAARVAASPSPPATPVRPAPPAAPLTAAPPAAPAVAAAPPVAAGPVAASPPPQAPAAESGARTGQDRVFISTITALRFVGHRAYVISLANGQSWQQEGAQVLLLFHEGDEVSVERGSVSTFMATTAAPRKRVIVTRVR